MGKGKVYVFIDDLDRCEHPKSADLMQALNLMIAEDPSVIFILGMDREKVAASLAVKFKDVLAFLPNESAEIDPEILATRTGNRGLAYGYTFIEKFVQLPFQVPQPSETDIDEFLRKMDQDSGDKQKSKTRQDRFLEFKRKLRWWWLGRQDRWQLLCRQTIDVLPESVRVVIQSMGQKISRKNMGERAREQSASSSNPGSFPDLWPATTIRGER